MSLITLTFGSKKSDLSSNPHSFVSTPADRVWKSAGSSQFNGILRVKKACRFYAAEHVFVLAEVAEGFIVEKMKALINNREVSIVEVESKYGRNAKKGMSVGVFLSNVDESEIGKGSLLEFKSSLGTA